MSARSRKSLTTTAIGWSAAADTRSATRRINATRKRHTTSSLPWLTRQRPCRRNLPCGSIAQGRGCVLRVKAKAGITMPPPRPARVATAAVVKNRFDSRNAKSRGKAIGARLILALFIIAARSFDLQNQLRGLLRGVPTLIRKSRASVCPNARRANEALPWTASWRCRNGFFIFRGPTPACVGPSRAKALKKCGRLGNCLHQSDVLCKLPEGKTVRIASFRPNSKSNEALNTPTAFTDCGECFLPVSSRRRADERVAAGSLDGDSRNLRLGPHQQSGLPGQPDEHRLRHRFF